MYYDIHTHRRPFPEIQTTSVYNLNVSDYVYCCGLDLKHLRYSLGIHPWKIREDILSKEIDFIEKNVIFDCVRAIGECGLDKLCETPWSIQLRAFVAQIKISEEIQKPLIIHCVKAWDEIITLKQDFKPKQAWIIHGFRGKPELAAQLIRNGFYLSLGAKYNDKSLPVIPLERLFIETDEGVVSIQAIYETIASGLMMSMQELKIQIESNVRSVGLFL